MIKKLLSLTLSLLLILSALALVSCTEESEGEKSSVSADADEKGFLNPAKDWGGQTVNILTFDNDAYSFETCQVDTEELTDEPVNDAFYERNALIKEKYGIEINALYTEPGEDYIKVFLEDMTSGLNEYDAIVSQVLYIANLAIEGNLVDFRTVNSEYIHIDQPWWDQRLIEDITINDKVFYLSGDALVEDDEATWAMFFNKDLVKSHSLEDPYQLVRDNKWTLDKMYELIQEVDLTHGSTKSYDPEVGDQWGMVAQSYDFLLFMQGLGQTLIDNSGDRPVLRIDNERNVQVFMKFCEVMYDEVNVGIADHHGSWNSGIYDREVEIFANGNALFIPYSISLVGRPVIREAEIRYGLLPMPKADELQDEYTTSINVYHYPVICLPITNVEKRDLTCYALEAMAYYGMELVTPEYYDRTLTYKRFTDDESGEMLDLIFRNRTYDMGTIFNFNNGNGDGTLGFFTGLIGQKSNNIVSHYESKKNAYQIGLDDFIAQCYDE